MKHIFASALLPLALLASCASIVDGTQQSLAVKTTSAQGDVDGAICELDSNKGTWFVTTPGSVTVHRGYQALNLRCTKDGYQPAIFASKSSTKGMAAGNLLFGGIIGAGVDMGTGAAYDYPNLITVMMQPVAAPNVAAIGPTPSTVASLTK